MEPSIALLEERLIRRTGEWNAARVEKDRLGDRILLVLFLSFVGGGFVAAWVADEVNSGLLGLVVWLIVGYLFVRPAVKASNKADAKYNRARQTVLDLESEISDLKRNKPPACEAARAARRHEDVERLARLDALNADLSALLAEVQAHCRRPGVEIKPGLLEVEPGSTVSAEPGGR